MEESILNKLIAFLNNNQTLSYEDIINLIHNLSREQKDLIIDYIKKGGIDTIKKLNEKSNLTNEQMCNIYKEGERKIMAFIFWKNKKLLMKRVNFYYKKYNNTLDFEDIVQYSYFGLINAVEKFDDSFGCKFTTYATWWIDQAIVNSIINCGTIIRLPKHIYQSINYINRIMLRDDINSEEQVIEIIKQEKGYDKEKALKLINYAKTYFQPISIYNEILKNDELKYIDVLADRADKTLEKQIEKRILTEEINELLKCLSKEESDIIKDIYGLDNTERFTLKEIAEKNNLTVEQVKQIEVQAIRKLRNSTKTNDLINFL